MTGYLRFVLASLVVANHVWLPVANQIGLYAVAGFFVISGYLMTMIVGEVYIGLSGLARYLANRFLRMLPLCWAVCGLTLVGLTVSPGATIRWFNPAIDRLRDVLRPKRQDKAALHLQSATALT